MNTSSLAHRPCIRQLGQFALLVIAIVMGVVFSLRQSDVTGSFGAQRSLANARHHTSPTGQERPVRIAGHSDRIPDALLQSRHVQTLGDLRNPQSSLVQVLRTAAASSGLTQQVRQCASSRALCNPSTLHALFCSWQT